MLTQLWFIVNTGFVAATIAFLFVNRSVHEAARRGQEARSLGLRRWRLAAGLLALLLFVAMSTLFLTNMHVNG